MHFELAVALQFITRTLGAKMDVVAMLNPKDTDQEDGSTVKLLVTSLTDAATGVWNALKASMRKILSTLKLHPKCLQPTNDAAKKTQTQALTDKINQLFQDDPAVQQNARAILKVYQFSSIAILILAFWYLCVVLISAYVASFAWTQAITLLAVVYLTLVPLLDFVANALKRGMDSDDKRKVDGSMYVVKGLIVLRSCLILCQGTLLTNSYPWRVAELMCWESYWTIGDASEKLVNLLTFDLETIFNFEINLLPKILSFVVLGLEVVALLGANLKATSTVRLFPRCCQRCLLHFARLSKRVGAAGKAIEKYEGIASAALDSYDEDGNMDPGVLLELAGPAIIAKLKPVLQKHLDKLLLKWEDIEESMEAMSDAMPIEELREKGQQALADPKGFLEQVAADVWPQLKGIVIGRLCTKLAPKLVQYHITAAALKAAVNDLAMTRIQDVLSDPGAFLSDLASIGGELAGPAIIAKLKPKLQRHLDKLLLNWDDIEAAINDLPIEELQQMGQRALADPQSFLEQLAAEAMPQLKGIVIDRLCTKLAPELSRYRVTAAALKAAVNDLAMTRIQDVLSDPGAFLATLPDAVNSLPAVASANPTVEGITVRVDGAVGVTLFKGVPPTVSRLTPEGAAEAAGVQVGARLIAFNGTDTSTMSKQEVMALISMAEGPKTYRFLATLSGDSSEDDDDGVQVPAQIEQFMRARSSFADGSPPNYANFSHVGQSRRKANESYGSVESSQRSSLPGTSARSVESSQRSSFPDYPDDVYGEDADVTDVDHIAAEVERTATARRSTRI